MDFKKFQQWCQDRGFIITLPSGYIRVNNLDVKDFGSFKGLFSLCMMFFEDELSKAFEKTLAKTNDNEASGYYSSDDEGIGTLERIYENNKVNRNRQHSTGAEIKFDNGSQIKVLSKTDDTIRSSRAYKNTNTPSPNYADFDFYTLNDGKSFVVKLDNDIVDKYTMRDFYNVLRYLLRVDGNGIVPMDEVLDSLESGESNQGENTQVGWCDIAREDKKRYEESKLKPLIDKIAQKYDSEE